LFLPNSAASSTTPAPVPALCRCCSLSIYQRIQPSYLCIRNNFTVESNFWSEFRSIQIPRQVQTRSMHS
jgi:hypothetical protein